MSVDLSIPSFGSEKIITDLLSFADTFYEKLQENLRLIYEYIINLFTITKESYGGLIRSYISVQTEAKDLFREYITRIENEIYVELEKNPIFSKSLTFALETIQEVLNKYQKEYFIEIFQEKDIEIPQWKENIILVRLKNVSLEESIQIWEKIESKVEMLIENVFPDREHALEAKKSLVIYAEPEGDD